MIFPCGLTPTSAASFEPRMKDPPPLSTTKRALRSPPEGVLKRTSTIGTLPSTSMGTCATADETTSASAMSLIRRLLHHRVVHHVADQRHVARPLPHGLDHEHHRHVLLRVDPEVCAADAVPGVIADRAAI